MSVSRIEKKEWDLEKNFILRFLVGEKKGMSHLGTGKYYILPDSFQNIHFYLQ